MNNDNRKKKELIVLLSTGCLREAEDAAAAVVPLISIRLGGDYNFKFDEKLKFVQEEKVYLRENFVFLSYLFLNI